MTDFNGLVGKVLTKIAGKAGDDEMVFLTSDGEQYQMYHSQDCCESVAIDDICGDLGDLIGTPIVRAEERSTNENPPGVPHEGYQDSFTWTFYELATVKGSVTIRWYGSSNGYYSERVTFCKGKRPW